MPGFDEDGLSKRLMSSQDVAKTMWNEIMAWKPASEMLPIRHGLTVAIVTCAASACYINHYFRRFFRLGRSALLSTYLAAVGPPVFGTGYLHLSVLEDIIVGSTQCPTCVQTRAMSLQAFLGSLYPMILSPVLCASIAAPQGLGPSITLKGNAIAVLGIVRKRPNVFVAALIINMAVAGAVAYLEGQTADKVYEKIINSIQK